MGFSYNSAGTQLAFLYSNGVMQSLDSLIGSSSSLYTLSAAASINDLGQIAVNGTVNATGQYVAFLLTPITSTSSSGVPAPATLGLLGFSFMGLLLTQRRRKTG